MPGITFTAHELDRPTGKRPGKVMPGITFSARVVSVVARIPRGRVATYGQVAAEAGRAGAARAVGVVMACLPDGSDVPWHRVVNARGEVSIRPGRPSAGEEQRRLLEREGVRFGSGGRIDLASHLWKRGR